jgi:RNA 3'-terminal phosphate cyclase (ATP)
VTATLEKPGFYPAGGGRFTVSIQPTQQLNPFELIERGDVVRRSARAVVANLSERIAERELKTVQKKLNWPEDCLHVVVVPDSPGPGNVVMLEVESEHVCEVFTGFGELNRSAEQVAAHAVQQCREYLSRGLPVGEYLADQLLLPLAIAGGGAFRAVRLSRHARTHIDLIQRFLDIRATCTEHGRDGVTLSLG